MIDFRPDDDAELARSSVRAFAESTLAPRAREFEQFGGLPPDVRLAAHDLGLGLLGAPERAGGGGASFVLRVLVEEELGAADAGAAFALAGPGALGLAASELAGEAQLDAALAGFGDAGGEARFGAVAWSEAKAHPTRAGFATVARPDSDGFVLTGEKAFVLGAPVASRFLVFAQVDEARGWDGIGAFLVEASDPGVEVGGRYATLGLDAASFAPVRFDGARVAAAARLEGAPHRSFRRGLVRFFAKHALLVAARAVGVARRAFDLAREHVDTRVAFGKPIGHFQAVAFNVADRLMDVESARWLVWRAAAAWDRQEASGAPDEEAIVASAQAAAHALEVAMRTTDDGVALHGGSGFIRDLLAEKLMRDAKQLGLSTLTTAQCDALVGALHAGPGLDDVDLAAILPTPEAQAIFL